MTVNTIDITSGPYTGNNITTEFSYTFRIDTKNQVSVYETDLAGVQTLLTVDTDYTVAGIGDDTGGIITRVAGALPTDYSWYIRANYQNTQNTDLDSQGGFFPEVHESALDKLTFLIQQLNDELSRAVRLSTSDSSGALTPLPELIANRFLRTNATADGFDLFTGSGDPVSVEVPLSSYDDFRNGVGFTIGDFSDGQIIWFANDGINGAFKLATGATPPDDGGVVIRSNVDTGRYVKRVFDGALNASWFGALTTNTAAQNSTAIQLAIDTDPEGNEIHVDKNVKFNLKTLDLTLNEFYLYYYGDDEDDRSSGIVPGTNERNYLSNNWKQDGGGTTDVNEWRYEGPHHPGIVLNCRQEIPKSGGAPANAKASVVYMKNGYNQIQEGLNQINDVNYFAFQTYEIRHTLNVGSSHFGVLPVVGQIVEGDTSGARGIILALTATTLLVSWLGGGWLSGETVTVNTTNTSTIPLPSEPSWVQNHKPFRFVMGVTGGQGVNTTPERALGAWHIGGAMTMETAQGGGLGTAAPRITVVDDALTPTTGWALDIDPVAGGLRLLDHIGLEQGLIIESDFTPTVEDAASGGNVATVAGVNAYYKKGLSGVVTFAITFINISTGALTGGNQIFIKGLPHTIKNFGLAQTQVNVTASGVASTTGHISGECAANTTHIALFDNTTTGRVNLNVSAITSGSGDLFISGTYMED